MIIFTFVSIKLMEQSLICSCVVWGWVSLLQLFYSKNVKIMILSVRRPHCKATLTLFLERTFLNNLVTGAWEQCDS